MILTIVSYLRFVLSFLFLFAAWRFGDWRNWRKYYPSILFFITVNFGISYLTYEDPLWIFHKALFIPNHTLTNFYITFASFSLVVFVYLSKYPYKLSWLRQIAYITLFVVFFTIIESIFMFGKLISYHHGWNFWWSVVVWIFMFIGLRLHHSNPLWAWLLCFATTIFLILYFHIPITKLR